MKSPVFVVGCPRSGNHLLYHMLLSSGDFAIYENHSHVFSMLRPKFGNLRVLKNRKKLMDAWLTGWLFECTGLDAGPLLRRILVECRSAGDFLRMVMEEMCRQQGVDRWAENTPDHLFHIQEIKRAFPQALIIHVIRDGRDVALSLDRLGWTSPLPWDKNRSWMAAALFWEWAVRNGQTGGRKVGRDYMEVRYEDLVQKPQEALNQIGAFIRRDLDYAAIQRNGIGAIRHPNSAFQCGPAEFLLSPVARWEKALSSQELAELEFLVGPLLQNLGYCLAKTGVSVPHSASLKTTRALYHSLFGFRQWLKSKTPAGRFINADLIYGDTGPATKMPARLPYRNLQQGCRN